MYLAARRRSFQRFFGFIPVEQWITHSVEWAIRSVITGDGEPDKRSAWRPGLRPEFHPFITAL
jgi:hypothetical protein